MYRYGGFVTAMRKKIELTEKLCEYCHNVMPMKRPRDMNKRFCNRKCSSMFLFARPMIVCPICSSPFHPIGKQKFCSNKCSHRAIMKVHKRVCKFCGEVFILDNIAYERRGDGKFCSNRCGRQYNKKYKFDEHFFDKIDTPQKAYWLGFLFADGYNSGDEIVINLATKDIGQLQKFKEDIGATQAINKRPEKYNRGNDTSSLRLCSKYICSKLTEIGCVKAKSYIVKFPENLQNDLKRHFIRGHFDGDGCIYVYNRKSKVYGKIKTYRQITIYSESTDFSLQLQKELKNFGIDSRMERQNRALRISDKENVNKFRDFIYEGNFYAMERKKEKFSFSND